MALLRAAGSLLGRASHRTLATGPEFFYQDPFPVHGDATEYDKIPGTDGLVTLQQVPSFLRGRGTSAAGILSVQSSALTRLAEVAIRDVSHLFRSSHLRQLRAILDDPEASSNDKFVAMEGLKNANVAASMVLPGCQDTGTAIVMGYKGERVWSVADQGEDSSEIDCSALSRGIFNAYTHNNLRYSQLAPLGMYDEVNTKTNLPAQIDLYSDQTHPEEYHLKFYTKGGGSANKTFLFQQTKALLNPASLRKFLDEKIRTIGTSACPPYHLAIVIGGSSAEANLKTVKLASARYLDGLPTKGNQYGQAYRDLELEAEVLDMTRKMGIGAQFGGKYFCHDVRVIRVARHGASCPVGMGVSCSADRQIKGKITGDGVFIERLERNPGQYLPEPSADQLSNDVVQVDLNRPMDKVLAQLYQYPIKTRLSLTGTMIVARDIAHAKLKERLESGLGLPQYFKDHIVYYAGPAKTPEGHASGSFGPTTAGRMDPYIDTFMAHGGSMISLAKGNRSAQVANACKQYKGFYLGSIGGTAASLASSCIKKVEVLDFPELGMEAVWKIDVENFPCFILIDHNGNDFFKGLI